MDIPDQFRGQFALAITVIDHASILAAFHSSPRELRDKIEYPLADAGFYMDSWTQFCTQDPADEDPTKFVEQINRRVFQPRREMSEDERRRLRQELEAVRKSGWR
jgi:hypothetical protein